MIDEMRTPKPWKLEDHASLVLLAYFGAGAFGYVAGLAVSYLILRVFG